MSVPRRASRRARNSGRQPLFDLINSERPDASAEALQPLAIELQKTGLFNRSNRLFALSLLELLAPLSKASLLFFERQSFLFQSPCHKGLAVQS
jgi:hypothetical protein